MTPAQNVLQGAPEQNTRWHMSKTKTPTECFVPRDMCPGVWLQDTLLILNMMSEIYSKKIVERDHGTYPGPDSS